VIQFFTTLIEGAFFTTIISTPAIFLGGTLIGLVMSLAKAVAVVFNFKPGIPTQDLATSSAAASCSRSRKRQVKTGRELRYSLPFL